MGDSPKETGFPQAIIFDFDGVIADSEPLHLRAYQVVLGPEGIELTKEQYYDRYLGYDDAGLFETLAIDRGIAASPQRIERWVASKTTVVERMLASDSVLFAGAVTCVKTFAAYLPLAIASGALQPEIEIVLNHAGLRDCFTAIASASDGVRGKPAPDLYMLAVAKLKQHGALDAAACVAVEDSRWGIDVARQAGLRCVAVTHTYPASELGNADLIVDRLSELTLSKIAGMRDNGPTR